MCASTMAIVWSSSSAGYTASTMTRPGSHLLSGTRPRPRSTDADANQPPVEMILNSSELRAAGFKLKDLLPPELEASARAGKRTRGAGLRQLQGMGPTRFVLSVDDDNEMRSRCE